ncbi:MAG: D-sedoheptulose 7-phosphate isomerase [Candidatus Omnitrophica bacterium]|nr:D-sedoheptulose 7-phosphate isomerase [Candidatus Omnitrophota bacterium]
MENKIKEIIKESISVKEKLIANSIQDIQEIINLCVKALDNGGKIIFCGNGGSAADSQHLAAELVVRFKKNRKSLPAIALTTNTSILTAIGNDLGFEMVFAKQLESLANKNDILVVISTSGKSKNVIEAVKKAKEIGVKTIAFTGENGKEFAKSCDLSFIVPSSNTARIQEAHICVGHIICELIEDMQS